MVVATKSWRVDKEKNDFKKIFEVIIIVILENYEKS